MNMAGVFERFPFLESETLLIRKTMEDDLEAYGIRNHPSVHSSVSL